MNERIGTSQIKNASPTWERPFKAPELSANRTKDDVTTWWSLVDRVIEIATVNGFTKSEVARRMQMPEGTFSQWFSGKYAGRLDTTNKQVEQWLLAMEEQAGLAASIPTSPGFIKTRISAEITETLAWAQMTADMVMITLAAGNGKTAACRHYCATRPHAYLATISPHTKTVHGMLVELAAELDVQEHNPAKLTRKIGMKLQRIGSGSLLIIDEAQNLVDDAINQLRHFVDVYQCGVALVGNNEVYTRFTKRSDGPSYDQLKSRLGKRLKRDKPRVEDLQAFIAAWGVADLDCVKLLTGIGMKGGALRQIDKTLKLASMLAMGAQEPLAKQHIEAAWKNRDVEDMA
ncbi:AAA family ATPase [Rhizobium sullae]|uniref:AAA family ATPase n=1 Tax=Rhizobium sullae TaxID=50338 RepID=A0ABY5XFD2_RHISU|nr:AAA family ATPase [Rhizobium sullae]UWU13248.1 AAA family ATPase [Rhizobium sullae]